MKGLELARRYYIEYGEPMLKNEFPELMGSIAVGLVGEGSECFGFDDDVSTDHDFEPGFCIFVDDGIDSRTEFRLERAYAKLPKEFCGFSRQSVSPVGGNRHGVIKIGDFYGKFVGSANGFDSSNRQNMLYVEDFYFATATNGEIWHDGDGRFSAIRKDLLEIPEDVRLKKLASRLVAMGQSGQYNFTRCLQHGEHGAAQLALAEFVKNAIPAVFLLNRKYSPYYKWMFRGMRQLERLSGLADSFECLLTDLNSFEDSQIKADVIEDIASAIIAELKEQGISDAFCNNLDTHAYSVNDKIRDASIRQMHIMSCV